MAECSDRKVKIGSRSLTEKGEELITKLSDYILKLTIDFSQEFTKNLYFYDMACNPKLEERSVSRLRFTRIVSSRTQHRIHF